MLIVNLILNFLLFFVLLNIGRFLERRHSPELPPQPWLRTIGLPLTLGIALTAVDNLRLVFFQQFILFIILAAVIYWIFSIFLKK